jgi:hypothetical protein
VEGDARDRIGDLLITQPTQALSRRQLVAASVRHLSQHEPASCGITGTQTNGELMLKDLLARENSALLPTCSRKPLEAGRAPSGDQRSLRVK